MNREQCSTGAHEAYIRYDESLGRRNSMRTAPGDADGKAKTRARSSRPHSMHERASSLRTHMGERVHTPSSTKRWMPHVDVTSAAGASSRSVPASPEFAATGVTVIDAAFTTSQPRSTSPPQPPVAVTTNNPIPAAPAVAAVSAPAVHASKPPVAAAPLSAAHNITPNAGQPLVNKARTPLPQPSKSRTPPNNGGALVPVSAAAAPIPPAPVTVAQQPIASSTGSAMTLHLTVPRDLTEAISDLRGTVAENTDLLSQLIAKQPGGNGDEPKKKPMSLYEPIKKPYKVMVECKVIFLKIGEIETLKEQYNAEVYVQAKWREPELDGLSAEKLAETDFSYYWNPNLYVENAQSQTKEKTWSTAVLDEVGECYIIERRRMKGVFAETLELNDFPFDCQDLTVTITTERSEKELELVPDLKEDSAVNLTQFVEQQEWTIHQYIETNIALRFNEYSYSKQKHPVFAVTSRASRKPGYFYWNIFLVMFFISTLSFATFSVKPELPQNRLQLTFTLLLTKVAFKFTVSQSLPRISYLTYLDKYILATMIMLYMVCIWYASVTVITAYSQELASRIDNYAFYAMVCIYVGFHIVFALWLYFDACQGRRSMFMKDKEMQRKIAETNKKQQEDMRDAT